MALGRPAIKKWHVINEMRKNIVSGVLKPGTKIPTRRKLAVDYDATLNTVQQALASLEREGFVYSQVGNGTFVVDNPPHLSDFALVFFDDAPTGLYCQHLAEAAKHVISELGLRLSIYTGVNENEPGEDYERLLDDVLNDRIAGIIFSNNPFKLSHSEIVTKPGVPRIMMGTADVKYSNMAVMGLNTESFIEKTLKYMQDKNIKNVAVIGQTEVMEESSMINAINESGIESPYYWQHSVELENLNWVRNITRLLFTPTNSCRPEALLILNDNFFDPAIKGVLDAGVNIPEDLEIIVRSNFPWQMESELPVTKIGHNMVELLELAMAELENQRSGKKPHNFDLDAIYEDELDMQDILK